MQHKITHPTKNKKNHNMNEKIQQNLTLRRIKTVTRHGFYNNYHKNASTRNCKSS